MAEKPDSSYRKVPSLRENVGKNVARDVSTLDRVATSGARGAAREALNEAGTRAATRMIGRAGAAGAALEAGWEAGRALDRATGVGKKMVNAAMGEPKYDGPRVELASKATQDRYDRDYGHEGKRTRSESAPAPKSRRVGTTGEWRDTSGVREGSNANISDETRARARRYTDDN